MKLSQSKEHTLGCREEKDSGIGACGQTLNTKQPPIAHLWMVNLSVPDASPADFQRLNATKQSVKRCWNTKLCDLAYLLRVHVSTSITLVSHSPLHRPLAEKELDLLSFLVVAGNAKTRRPCNIATQMTLHRKMERYDGSAWGRKITELSEDYGGRSRPICGSPRTARV